MSLTTGWDKEDRRVVPVRTLDFVLEPGGWPELKPHQAQIDAYFAGRVAENPHLWNGAVLLVRHSCLEDGAMSGTFRRTDFASFLWWRTQGWPNMGLRNAFALAALEGADGGFVLGVMGPQTSAAGQIYFPGGTPDLSDITPDGHVDLAASSLREMTEETGLLPADVAQDNGFMAVYDGPRLALLRQLVFAEPAEALAARIRGFLEREEMPELSDVVVVHGEQDMLPAIAPYAASYMRARWAMRSAPASGAAEPVIA